MKKNNNIKAFSYRNEEIRPAFTYREKQLPSTFSYSIKKSEKKVLPAEKADMEDNASRKERQVEIPVIKERKVFPSEVREEIKQPEKLETSKEKEMEHVQVVTEIDNKGGRNFSLKLLAKIYIYDENEMTECWYGFEITIAGKTIYREVKAENVEKFHWVLQATNGRAFMGKAVEQTDFKTYIHEVLEKEYDAVPCKYRYKQSGWKKMPNGKLFYVCDSGIVGRPTDEIKSVSDLQFEIDQKKVGTIQNFQEFYGMQRICKNIDFSRTLMVYTSLSVLTTVFEKAGFPIKFLVGVLGTTNTLKTSSTLVFSKIFNAGETDSPEVTFLSTPGGIEKTMAKYRDAILLVDDFMPAESRKKQSEQNSKLELLCRSYGDRTSKKRMTVFIGKDVEFPVRGCCIFTGELLTGVESSRTRILQLKLQRGQIDKDVLSYYQERPLILPTYLYSFIDFVQANLSNVQKLIAERVKRYRAEFQYSTARLSECQAILFVMVDLMIWYWSEKGFIVSCEEIVKEWKCSIQNIVEENQRQLASYSLPEMTVRALMEKLYEEPHKLKNIDEMAEGQPDCVYEDEKFYYVHAKDLCLKVENYCRRYGLSTYLTPNIIIAKLRERDILETFEDKKGHVESSRKLQQGRGNKKRFLYIKKQKVNEIMQNRMEVI